VPSFPQILLFAIAAAGAAFWWSGARAREIAIVHAKRSCSAHQLQFLDQTVALQKIRWQRASNGQLTWKRVYSFEYAGASLTNHFDPGSESEQNPLKQQRDRGYVHTLGAQVQEVEMPFIRDEDGNRIYFQ